MEVSFRQDSILNEIQLLLEERLKELEKLQKEIEKLKVAQRALTEVLRPQSEPPTLPEGAVVTWHGKNYGVGKRSDLPKGFDKGESPRRDAVIKYMKEKGGAVQVMELVQHLQELGLDNEATPDGLRASLHVMMSRKPDIFVKIGKGAYALKEIAVP